MQVWQKYVVLKIILTSTPRDYFHLYWPNPTAEWTAERLRGDQSNCAFVGKCDAVWRDVKRSALAKESLFTASR